ncbi:tRNA pseudouridine synthase Pus10 [Rhynchospora pubera]|uniref:tRNA pseudouridine(55) synthase n=1 Tax=Rhynchospora pubera TaxID=906938 RepID=A0AAV8GB88_9POAL|nr:tRNA pseudouridine synthase Pus10 [Rhynchospora pubera]KAJ4800148.1 tRNA pseudouridine synthase Pus10 [Rhynchospora pubera]
MTSPGPAIEWQTALGNAKLCLPPSHVIRDLLSTGVCVRCIFRLSGIHDRDCYISPINESELISFLEEQNEIECNSTTITNCCVCLGVLCPSCVVPEKSGADLRERSSVNELALLISDMVKGEQYQIDEFSLEVSLPPVITANERALRLYLKQKYEKEQWFKDTFLRVHISVKDTLKLVLNASLENYLAVQNVETLSSSFRIRLTYSHSETSQKLQSMLPNGHDSKKREKGSRENGSSKNCNEPDASAYRVLELIEDQNFCSQFQVPPGKVDKPCQLVVACCRTPTYIGGRYLKYSRNVSQSRWIIDDERMGETSVEEIIGENVRQICQGDGYKFHSAGREDIDVRMLGSGRPFLVEVSNSRIVPSSTEIEQISDKINHTDKQLVGVKNLKLVGAEAWDLMREGEAEKQKQYAALVWISRPLNVDDVCNLTSLKDMEISQKTPIRVLHRRSPLERSKVIHWMKIEKVEGTTQYFLLHLCTQAGTYIKEFVHGDLGRTHPSIGSILGCRAEILQLDVTDVKMDYFD